MRAGSGVITGIGAVGAVADNGGDLPLSKDPAESAKVSAVHRNGGCVQIGYSVLDAAGKSVPTPYKTVGLGPEDLRDMVHAEGREVILIAGGDRRRFLPIKVALSAGLVTWLVSDTITAKFLVDEL